ncbi:MAG: gamma-glutamyl-gamma-aminobutyrate hydrolase PuuD [Planctomycetota bacterium]|jgi:gamma-glutamyl-gamma-aminobutyrate hydrolase PuuD
MNPTPRTSDRSNVLRIAVSQRVYINAHAERLDALDQRWPIFLRQCGCECVPLPNVPQLASARLADSPIDGVLLTGGNDLQRYGGDAPERDATEQLLLRYARERQLPLIGVCRGMQVLQDEVGLELTPVEGHVSAQQCIQWQGAARIVNSYHNWGTTRTSPEYDIIGHADDGTIKAIQHRSLPWLGVMWHPERIHPFASEDLTLFREHLSGLALASPPPSTSS